MELQLHKLDKKVLIKAVGICAMSWLAIPVIYYLLKKHKGVKKEENERISGEGRGDNIPE